MSRVGVQLNNRVGMPGRANWSYRAIRLGWSSNLAVIRFSRTRPAWLFVTPHLDQLVTDGLPYNAPGISLQHVEGGVLLYLRTCKGGGVGVVPAHVSIDATTHKLRHHAGTSWYRASGHDLLTTQALLRHASVSSTQIYAATDPTRPAEVVNLVPLRLVDPGVAL